MASSALVCLRQMASARTATEEEAYNLFIAARSGDAETLALMLERGVADLNPTDANNLTPLSVAVQRGHTEPTRMLLDARANAEVKDTSGQWTALHHAASEGADALVALLINGKANVNSTDNVKDTPLNEAVRGGHVTTARLLIDGNASVLSRSHGGNHALALARSRDASCKKAQQKKAEVDVLATEALEAAELLALMEAAAVSEEAQATQRAAEVMAAEPTPSAAAAAAEVDVSDAPGGTDDPSATAESAIPSASADASVSGVGEMQPRDLTYTERRSDGRVAFSTGDEVTIQLLQSRPELNGRRAKVLGTDGSSGRYKVRVQGDAGPSIKVKAECLLPVLDEGPDDGYAPNY